jgi:hypothetical protein
MIYGAIVWHGCRPHLQMARFEDEGREATVNPHGKGHLLNMRTPFSHYAILVSVLAWVCIFSDLQAPLSEAIANPPAENPVYAGLATDRDGGSDHDSGDMILVTESIGTAWPVAPGYLVTNNHVVSDADTITLVDHTGREWVAWPVLLDEMNDIAFLEVSDAQNLPPALPLARSRTDLDTRVFTVGFPSEETSRRAPTRSHGNICGLKGTGADDASYRTTVSVQHGNSGGPLVNMTGEVVGVVRSMLAYRNAAFDQTHVLKNASCAVKIDALKELLHFLPEKRSTLRTFATPTDSPEALYDAVAHSVLRVVARRSENAPAQ